MSTKLVISSPNVRSKALKALAKALSEKVGYRVYRVLPHRIRRRRAITFLSGVDKVVQFSKFREHDVSSPRHVFMDSLGEFADGTRIVARKLTNSCEGKGITIFKKGEDPTPPAPLYTEYIPKKKEFRVHVWNGEVIDVSEKRKKKGFEGERDTMVRNIANGYVFCRTNITEPADLRMVALSAVQAIGRTYGAVDVIWNEKRNKCYALEVNSRPGMEGKTVDTYVNAIMKGIG